MNSRSSIIREKNLSSIFQWRQKNPGSLILAGDFNANPWSRIMKTILDFCKLKIASAGHFLNFTWQYPGIPLYAWFDHVLISEDIYTQELLISEDFGSDHRMIRATLSW